MTDEQENFYRHCTVIVDVTKYLFLQLIEFYLKLNHFTTFGDFVKKYQHEIYHLCYNMYKCCNCSSGIYRQGSKALYPQQMALLFDTSGPKLRCHNINSRSSPNCCCQVKTGITVQLLDISLARTLMINYLVPPGTQEKLAIEDLVNIRNNSYGHATSGRMSNDEFKQSIEIITNNLMIIARLCNKETETKQMLSDAVRQPLNIAVCTQLQTTLLQQIKREDKIEQELKEIKSALEDQKSSKDVDTSDTFVSLLGKQEVYEGQDVQFECKVITSKLQGKWYKDGDPICDSQDVRITQKGRELCLNIYGTVLQDRGEYSCVVNDRETKAFLDVRVFFTITLRDKSCYEGDTITFTCEVIDLLTTAQWYKDKANIDNSRYVIKPMGKTHQLTIKYAKLCDSGCFVVDVNGRCRQASLEVKACFITDIKNISCIEGQNVFFSCEIDPRDAAIQWFHGKTEIKSSEKYILQCENRTNSLEIRNVDIGDSGEITIRVKNCSRACKLDVRKCFLKELESTTIREGYSVQFACEVSCQEVIGTWYKDDEKIENTEKFVIKRCGTKNGLDVNNTSLDDNGTYSFKVHNKVTKASLDVEGYFRKNPINVTCKEGEVVHITCEAIETSIPAQWCKDGMDIDFNNFKFSKQQNRNEYQLTIRSTNQTDSGCYSVNVNGRIRRAFVTVRDYSTMILNYITCKEGETARLKCEATENSIEVKWYKDTEEISFDRYIEEQQEQRYQLTRSNIDTMDHGHNILIVNGRRTRTALLMVKGYSEHEEPFFYSGVDVKFKAQSTKKFDFNQHVSTLKSFTLTNITGGSFQERDTCILFSWKLHRSAPPDVMKQIIIEDKTVHQNLDILLFSENEGQFSLEVLSDVTEYTASTIATSFQNFRNDSQVGNLEDVLEFLKSGEIKTDFIKPSNTQIKMNSKDKNDSQTAECPRTKSTVSINEPYRLGKHKEYHRKLPDKIIECENQEKFSKKRWEEYNCDKHSFQREGWVKMKNSKVKQVNRPSRWKINLRTQEYELENLVGEYCGMDIPSFKRPSVPWQRMNPQLPISFKLRFLDEEDYHAMRDHRTSCEFNTLQQDGHPTKQCDSCESDCSCAKNNHGNL